MKILRSGQSALPVRHSPMFRTLRSICLAFCLLTGGAQASLAVDPPYQAQMERLAEILGSLYMLAPLCEETGTDWRAQMSDLIALDEPEPDRRSRIVGAFNAGYEAYARFYRSCTPSAQEAMRRLLTEGESAARDIHARYAE